MNQNESLSSDIVSFVETEGALNCVFSSAKLDSENSIAVEKPVMDRIALAGGGKVIFNLEKVNYVSSAFLRICIRAAKELGKDRFAIVGITPLVKKVFQIAGMAEIIEER